LNVPSSDLQLSRASLDHLERLIASFVMERSRVSSFFTAKFPESVWKTPVFSDPLPETKVLISLISDIGAWHTVNGQ